MSSVVGVCVMYYRCLQPVRQAACGLQSVTACLGRYVHSIWSASPSRLTLAYSLPTAIPNKALNRVERLQTPKEVQSEQKSHTISSTICFRNNLFTFLLPQSFEKEDL